MIKIIFLSIIQGITEFLPVSSSAHLVLSSHFMKIPQDITLDVFLHLGTAMSVIFVFRKHLYQLLARSFKKSKERRLSSLIILGTIPAGVIGVLAENQIENFFSDISYPAIFLGITALILLSTKLVKNNTRTFDSMNVKDALIIGLTQAIAILPGISRSGITIATGLFRNIEEKNAIEFSFLLSLPVILGASVLKLKQLLETTVSLNQIKLYSVGIFFSFLSGLFAIKFLMKLAKGKFHYFAFYCFAVSVLIFII